ncbi:hypothetical protein CEH05_04550 [Halobacillus halophilus]|nr:hypothetical protein CEH05_04550 [Halobacillus halophilus]
MRTEPASRKKWEPYIVLNASIAAFISCTDSVLSVDRTGYSSSYEGIYVKDFELYMIVKVRKGTAKTPAG